MEKEEKKMDFYKRIFIFFPVKTQEWSKKQILIQHMIFFFFLLLTTANEDSLTS